MKSKYFVSYSLFLIFVVSFNPLFGMEGDKKVSFVDHLVNKYRQKTQYVKNEITVTHQETITNRLSDITAKRILYHEKEIGTKKNLKKKRAKNQSTTKVKSKQRRQQQQEQKRYTQDGDVVGCTVTTESFGDKHYGETTTKVTPVFIKTDNYGNIVIE